MFEVSRALSNVFETFRFFEKFKLYSDLDTNPCFPICKIEISDKTVFLTYVQYFNLITKGLNDNFILFMINSYEKQSDIQNRFRNKYINALKKILAKRNPKYGQNFLNNKYSKTQNNFPRESFKTKNNYKQKNLTTFYYHQNRKISHLKRAIT